MNVCLIADNPETSTHPVIGVVLQQLCSAHEVRLLDVSEISGDQAVGRERQHPLADIYLLKSHTPQALEVAHYLEQRGAMVINSFASSSACQDRALMAQRMSEAHLAFPSTSTHASLGELLEQQQQRPSILSFPLVIKSRYSRRGDLVYRADGIEQLHALARRIDEPVIIQEFVPTDGWDIKLWVIGQQIFAARRRSSLAGEASRQDFPIPTEQLPSSWRSISLKVGRVFDLHLYGLDLIASDRGPVVVDVNSFPGFRGVGGAASALLCLIERLSNTRRVESACAGHPSGPR
ncbi:MAG: alpha-L-glutamate ligase [Gammaproteobacteria bacterium]|nr:MAG: alpha-L-glutamate ligase [Gammaproteobacteria bacterium]